MRLLICVFAAGMSVFSGSAMAVVEEFDGGLWAHHESLSSQVLTDDLIITAESGGSMKGVRDPHALYPGFDPTRPATAVIIEPRNHAYLTLQAVGGTDLFQMAEPLLTVRGFRDGQEVVAQSMGPLWSDDTKSGVVAILSGFEKVERVEIRSDDSAPVSDVHFFLESVAYEVMDEPPVTPPSPRPVTDQDSAGSVPTPFGNGGAVFGFWFFSVLLILRRYKRI